MNVAGFIQSNGVYIAESTRADDVFAESYLLSRSKEKRIYSDRQLRMLPDIATGHPHFKEWLARKNSGNKLFNYLAAKKRVLHILEVGCGNGWLSNRLSAIPGSEVTGSDINLTELEQAARVFGYVHNLQFLYGDIRWGISGIKKFDTIVFAASIQYFSCLPEILHTALLHLHRGGEIHIIDSNFYKPSETTAAKKRTEDYYTALGFPEMAEHYFHHSIPDLQSFRHTFIYDPSSIKNLLLGNRHPFPWICIKNE